MYLSGCRLLATDWITMHSSDKVRKIDSIGRIVIPAWARRLFGIENGTEIAITAVGDAVVFRVHDPDNFEGVVMTRKVDKLGRLVISMETRRLYGFDDDIDLEFEVVDDGIYVRVAT